MSLDDADVIVTKGAKELEMLERIAAAAVASNITSGDATDQHSPDANGTDQCKQRKNKKKKRKNVPEKPEPLKSSEVASVPKDSIVCGMSILC